MKCLIRFCSLALCLSFLFFAFSPVVNAEELTDYHIYATAHSTGGNFLTGGMHYPYDSTRQTITYANSLVASDGFKISAEMYLSKSDKTALFSKGNIVTGKLENVYIGGSVNLPSIATYSVTMKTCSVSVIYTDGNIDYITCGLTKLSSGYYTIDFSFEADKDVSQLFFQISTNAYSMVSAGDTVTVNLYMGEPTLETEPNTNIIWGALSYEIESAETGWLAKIWQKLTGGFSDMVNKLGEAISAIIELPEQIWNYISDGLSSLFVPDDDYIIGYKDRWSDLMSDKLGAVWQVIEITFGAWEDVGASDKANTIAMPKVTIPLPGDNEFSFGGYDVKVVPDGFDFLATACKTIAGIVCTMAFINGLRHRYDEVMGVEK